MTALTADPERFDEAIERAALAVGQVLDRINNPRLHTQGAQHINRVLRDCVERRLPGEQTALRLTVAADLADVLDGAR